MTRISYFQRVRIFGLAGTRKNTVTVVTPWGMSVVVHKKIEGVFRAACIEANNRSAWKPKRVDSMNYRPIRNALSLSLHSWALAFDFFATGPGIFPAPSVFHPDNTVPQDFAAAFERQGFTWGAKFKGRKDWPHIEWAGGEPGPIKVPTIEEAQKLVANKPVKIIGTETNHGYLIFTSNGGVYPFGDAAKFGSGYGKAEASSVVDADLTSSGKGAWLVLEDGGVIPLGDAKGYKDSTGKTSVYGRLG